MILDRFSQAIHEHMVLSLLELETHPVIMGIFGLPGEGKTYQMRTLLRNKGVSVYSVSAAELESDRAGNPGKVLLEYYLTAASAIAKKRAACVVVDDIDTTVGEWENNTGTVNHQQVLAQLMHFADNPCEIERVGKVCRVPIFVTGNDFAKLYPPLRRPGRLFPFYWEPTTSEKFEVVTWIFDGLLHSHFVDSLVQAYSTRPVSFFSDLHARVVRANSMKAIARLGVDLNSVAGDAMAYRHHLRHGDTKITKTIIFEEAERLDTELRAMDTSHLERPVARSSWS